MEKKHNFILNDRKELKLDGILSVVSFQEDSAELETNFGFCQITGKNLHMARLDLEKGEAEMTGEFESVYYPPSLGEQKKGFFQKLFT